jgi:DNA-directed RNA polymerase specialized sigma24 family protein
MTQTAKAALRAALQDWPTVTPEVDAFLQGLHWRIRQSVVLTYGQGYTHDQAAARLRVSPSTIAEDVGRAAEAWRQAAIRTFGTQKREGAG